MSEIGLSFNAETRPSPVGARLQFSFSDTTLKATVQSVDDFVIFLSPSGNVGEQILSGIAWPLAQTIGALLPALGKSLINGFSFDAVTLKPIVSKVQGEDLTISPRSLSMSEYNGMVMVQGSLDFS